MYSLATTSAMAERVWPVNFALGLFAGLVRAFEGIVAGL